MSWSCALPMAWRLAWANVSLLSLRLSSWATISPGLVSVLSSSIPTPSESFLSPQINPDFNVSSVWLIFTTGFCTTLLKSLLLSPMPSRVWGSLSCGPPCLTRPSSLSSSSLPQFQFSPTQFYLRCLEPVELTKNLAQNRNICIPSSFEHRILEYFKNALKLQFIYVNILLDFKCFL